MSKVILLNTAHFPLDDRVFYHQSRTFIQNGFEVIIISTKQNLETNQEGVLLDCFNDEKMTSREKMKIIKEKIKTHQPDFIICDSPLAIFSAYRSTKKTPIIYDITEWYPAKKNLKNSKHIHQIFKFIVLALTSFVSGFLCKGFIFGEYYKSIPFKFIYFWKKRIELPYYPLKLYFPRKTIEEKPKFTLLYSGLFNADKGFFNFVNVIMHLSNKIKDEMIVIQLIGEFENKNDEKILTDIIQKKPKNFTYRYSKRLDFREFCGTISNGDLFFDLRNTDLENTHCLPIKIFYYMACGRPIIFSDLKALSRFFPEIDFGFLCNPKDADQIANLILQYLHDKNLYRQHCSNSSLHFENKYNWDEIENKLITFIQSLK